MSRKQSGLGEFRAIAAASGGKNRPCKVGKAKDALSPKDSKLLDEALAQSKEDIPSGAIRIWLEKRGHEVSDVSVTTHRYRKCKCVKDAVLNV